jgi:hypothetical protein
MRSPVLLAVVLVCALSGCSSQPSHDDAQPPPREDVVLPEGHKKLVPTVRRTGDATLPAFTPQAEGYTLFLRCNGKGSVTVKYNEERDVDTWPCDGVLNRSKVYADKGRQQLHVSTDDGTAWSAGVVDGLA